MHDADESNQDISRAVTVAEELEEELQSKISVTW